MGKEVSKEPKEENKDNNITEGLEFSDDAKLDSKEEVEAREEVKAEEQHKHNDVKNHIIVGGGKKPINKKLLVAIVVLLLIVAGLLIYYYLDNQKKAENAQDTKIANSQVQQLAEVSISADGVVPETITVKKGQTVVWKNNDKKDHQIAADPYPTNESLPELGKGEVLKPGDTFGFPFDTPGTYTYHDNLNPFDIRGTVIVTE
jgi:plastocyanin